MEPAPKAPKSIPPPPSFIQTPLDFFGHSAEKIYFGYPAQYDAELNEAKRLAETRIETMVQRWDEGVTPENAESIAEQTQQEVRQAVWQHNHTWYERRFRGRNRHQAMPRHPQVAEYFEWPYMHLEGPRAPKPSTQEISSYLNDSIVSNEWSNAYFVAKQWHGELDEADPEREVARDYVGFAGNIILREYCRTAAVLAADELADDDFFSFKHLLTICWPKADELEAFIPDEAGRAKQYLREVFLQYAVRGGESIRQRVDILNLVRGNEKAHFSDRTGQVDELLGEVMAFTQDFDKAEIMTKLNATVDWLEHEHQWYRAIDLLDLSHFAFGISREEIKSRIDDLAIKGTLHYTADMSVFRKTRMVKHGKHEYACNNLTDLMELQGAPSISDEIRDKMRDIEDVRMVEHAHYVWKASKDFHHEKFQETGKLFEVLAGISPDLVPRFSDPEMVTEFIAYLGDSRLLGASPATIDRDIVEPIIRLRNSGLFTREQQNEMLTTLLDNIFEPDIARPLNWELFEKFIAIVSPILRGTDAAETPAQEAVWRFMQPKQLEHFFVMLAEGYVEEDKNWFAENKPLFLNDFRGAWGKYWSEYGEYSW